MNARQTDSLSLTERARQNYQQGGEHPFRVGETYANRQGKYEVLEIAPPRMTVRYETGSVMMADITILARIWENMQLPPEQAETGSRQRAAGRAATPRAPRTVSQFRGLSEGDFKPGVGGTSWRTRLGQSLAARLSEIMGVSYRSFPVENRAELYLAREHHFNGRYPEHRAKFLFRLTATGAEYGFFIERDAQKMDRSWDWVRFVAALRKPGPWAAPVEQAMRELGLEAEAESSNLRIPEARQEPGLVGRWTVGDKGLTFLAPDGSADEPCEWQDMATVLTAAEPRLWCNFYILGRIEKTEAQALRERLADRAAQTFAALAPLYDASAR